MGTLGCQKAPSFGWDVKPRSWLSVVNKNPMVLLVKSRGEPRCPGQIPTTGPCQSWPPNNPHWTELVLSLSLLSTCSWCVVSALAPLSCGSRRIIQVDAAHWWWLRRDPPPHDCKVLWVYSNTEYKALYKCIIHKFTQSTTVSDTEKHVYFLSLALGQTNAVF